MHFRHYAFTTVTITTPPAGSEQDTGTHSPTLMQDTNGNQILIRYYPGSGVTYGNSSARIQQIEDVRAVAREHSTPYYSYNFNFSNEVIPHRT